MHDGMPYGRNQGQGQGQSREVDHQSPTGLIFHLFFNDAFEDALVGRSQWSSGSMPDCSAQGPGIELRCRQLCLL